MAEAGVLELVELDVALDWTPACEWGGLWRAKVNVSPAGCSAPAEWVGRSTCCGMVRLFCGPHKVERDAFVAGARQPVHSACGAPGAPIEWSRLGGGS